MISWWLILVLLAYFVICLLLIGVILIQSGKGGGLSSLAQASSGITDALGATGAEKTLNKITTTIAVSFMVLAIFLSVVSAMRNTSRSASEQLGIETTAPPAAGTGATATVPIQPAPAEPGSNLPPEVPATQPIEIPPVPASEPSEPEAAPEAPAAEAPPVAEPAPAQP